MRDSGFEIIKFMIIAKKFLLRFYLSSIINRKSLMQISFKGIKNPGAYTHHQKYAQSVSTGGQSYILPKGRSITFHCELTNNGGKDLDEFKDILRAFPNKYNPNSLTVGYEWFINPNNGQKNRLYFINNNHIELNEVTFNVFNKIFKLMKKISAMPREQIIINNSYLTTPEAKDAFLEYTAYNTTPDIYKILNEAHNRDNVLAGAKLMGKKFANALTAYVLS